MKRVQFAAAFDLRGMAVRFRIELASIALVVKVDYGARHLFFDGEPD